MRIGVPKEIKNNEYRVGLTPESVKTLVSNEHEVFIQHNAGKEIGFSNADYTDAGGKVLETPQKIFESSELIIKVKEPASSELSFLSENHTLFTYLHLAGDKRKGLDLTATGVTGIAYETVTSAEGSLPLLAPMSAIAGQLSILVGSYHLLKHNKGKGTLIGSFGELGPRIVTVIGAGTAGTEAIDKAIANNAHVRVIDLSEKRLGELEVIYGEKNIEYIVPTPNSVADAISNSDLVIGSAYVVGREAPKIVKEEMILAMEPGTVMVDISIDQGGCFETSRPTSHDEPIFLTHGIVQYCVTNMPGAVPLTATLALNQATLPYILDIANKGTERALEEDGHLLNGLNVQSGKVVHEAVRKSLK
jgi:alanine dehydrogenase